MKFKEVNPDFHKVPQSPYQNGVREGWVGGLDFYSTWQEQGTPVLYCRGGVRGGLVESGLTITASPLVTRSLSLCLSSPHDVNSSHVVGSTVALLS